MQSLANSYAFWVFLVVGLVAVYLLPTAIGLIRGVDRMALVFLVNLIGAPTGVGWVAAMILAFGPRRPTSMLAWPQHAGTTGERMGTWTPHRQDIHQHGRDMAR